MIFFLIGLPGCGKSTLGKKFAFVLDLPFYDLDHLIEAGEGAKISDLFSLHGEQKFREMEQRYLHKLNSLEKAVIATGGGTPCFFNNMELINSLGMSVFLDVPPKEIALRLSENGISKRPILKGKSREEICLTLEHLRHIRIPFYSKSHITIHNPDIRFNEFLLAGFQK
jgi:shikimate kinase